MLFVLDKNKTTSLFFSQIRFLYTVFFHKIDGSFYSSIESNGLVEIQGYIHIRGDKLEMA